MKDVVFVTGNAHKAKYFSHIVGFTIENHAVNLPEIQSVDMKEITEDKARRAYDILKRPVIVEDVALNFEALGRLPGPFIKFFVEETNGLENLCRMLDGFTSRRAHTVVMTTYYDGKKFTHFEGGSYGEIADHPRGSGGFGYDMIWCVDGYGGKTRAELSRVDDEASYINTRPIARIQTFFASNTNE